MNQEIRNIFFEALDYPEYVRPFFYLKKQQESGWHKGIFIEMLNHIYWHYEDIFKLKLSQDKLKNNQLTKDDIQISLSELTNAEINIVLTYQNLKNLHVSVMSMYEIDKEVKNFDSFEVISFVEYSLKFIKNEFQIILKEVTPDSRKTINTSYLIATDAPFFDFYRFRNESRKMLFSSRNLRQVKSHFKRIYSFCADIIGIWNTKIYVAQQNANDDEAYSSSVIRITFESESMRRFERVNDFETFDIKQHERFLLYDLALFAARVGDFISEEILDSKKRLPLMRKKPFEKDFLEGIHMLQKTPDEHDFITKIKTGKSKKEAPFRNWFVPWFKAKGYNPEVEPPKENGRIDLRISHGSIPDKIIEFKGWWNPDKKQIVQQVHSYLTEFEEEGFIFLINNEQKSIIKEYQALIESSETYYETNSWEVITNTPSSYIYYKSIHQFGEKRKILYHFIYSVWPNGKLNRIPKKHKSATQRKKNSSKIASNKKEK